MTPALTLRLAGQPALHFALANLLRDRRRFAATITGVAFAVLLMIFQGSLFVSFRATSSRIVTAMEADLWLMPRGVACFDCTAPLPLPLREQVFSAGDIAWAEPIAMSFAALRNAGGDSRTVTLIGSDRLRARFMLDEPPTQEAMAVDASALGGLGVGPLPAAVEINQRRARVTHATGGYGTFLIGPFAFGGLDAVQHMAGLDADSASFIALKLAPGADAAQVQARLQRRFPELDVQTTAGFATRSANYWMLQSGAGAALALAGVLGFVVGIVVVSQTLYARTVENLDEYATLLAVGSSPRFILRVIGLESALSGLAGYAAGALAVAPLIVIARQVLVSWVYLYGWLLMAVALLTALMCALASLASVRLALHADPARVFRV
jgi:putative ABC transport system permease protein